MSTVLVEGLPQVGGISVQGVTNSIGAAGLTVAAAAEPPESSANSLSLLA
jgi:hypothetical protein